MKSKFGLMTMVALGGLVAFGPMAVGQEKKENKPDAQPGSEVRRRAGGAAERLKQISEELKLTDEQKAKLKPMIADEAKKLRELRQDTNLSRQDRRAKLKEIRDEAAGKIKLILTPEQQEKWAKIREQAPARRRAQQ